MRTLDFAPFFRSTIGFDRCFSMLDQISGLEGAVPGYPPYDIERVSEGRYRISVAVAGFTDGELSLEVKENKLTIRGEKHTSNVPTTRCSTTVLRHGASSGPSNLRNMLRSRTRAWRTVSSTLISCANSRKR